MEPRHIAPLPVGVLLLLDAVAPAAAQPTPAFEEYACELPASAVANQATLELVRCGRVAVPRRYDDPAAGNYSLRVAVAKAALEPVQPDPLLVTAGGPGASPVDAALALAAEGRIPPLERDTVFIDPRGVAGSEPNVCRDEALTAWLDLYAADLTTGEMGDVSDSILRRCFTAARAGGHAPESFGSKIDADDIEHARRALGITSWNVYGVSYGGVLALTLAQRYPETIRSLVLDSPGLGALTPVDRRDGWAAARAVLLASCAADAACGADYPDLGREIDLALERLESQPFRIVAPDREMTLNRGDLEMLLFGMLYRPDSAAGVPALVRGVTEGRGDDVIRHLTFAASVMTQLSTLNWGATLCRDNALGSKLGRTPGPPVGYEALLPGNVCAEWGEPDPSPPPLPRGTAIPTLVLSGSFDPVTPPDVGRYAASLVGRTARHIEIPGKGHGVLDGSPCTLAIFAAFLADPTAPLDTSCIDDLGPLTFTSPAPSDG